VLEVQRFVYYFASGSSGLAVQVAPLVLGFASEWIYFAEVALV
jgi:hypothetical protein